MQVQLINNQPTNFRALRSVDVQGRFLKNNQWAVDNIMGQLNSSESFQNFIKKHDVKISLQSCDYGRKEVDMTIYYEKNLGKLPKIDKIFEKLESFLLGPYEISAEGKGQVYNEAVENLVRNFSKDNLYGEFDDICKETDEEAQARAEKISKKQKNK